MKIRSAAFVIALCAASLPQAAQANWHSTQWGQTVDQVIKAGKSELKTRKLADNPENYQAQMPCLAEGESTEFGLKVKVRFCFKPDSRTLALVQLIPVDPWRNSSFEEFLLHQYGTTKIHTMTDPADGSNWRQMDWPLANGDLVRLTEVSKDAGEGFIWTVRKVG